MSTNEMKSLIVALVGVVVFSIAFTFLYRSLVKTERKEIEEGEDDIELIDEIIHAQNINVKKRTKIAGYFKSGIFYLFLTVLLGLLGYGVFSKINGNLPLINGKTVMVVASGSMSLKNEVNEYLFTENLNNQIPTYAIIVLEKTETIDDIELYDVIAFVNEDGINLIHRVKEITEINGEIRYITRGDSNNENDNYNPSFDDVIGKYTGEYVSFIGIFVLFIQSIPGIITLLGIAYCIVLIDRLGKIRQETIAKRAKMFEDFIFTKIDNETYSEMIYYQNYVYHLNHDGLVQKSEIEEGAPYFNEVDNKIIKVLKKENVNVEISELILFNEEIEGGN